MSFIIFVIGFLLGLVFGTHIFSIVAVTMMAVGVAGCAIFFTLSDLRILQTWQEIAENFTKIWLQLMGLGLGIVVARWLVEKEF